VQGATQESNANTIKYFITFSDSAHDWLNTMNWPGIGYNMSYVTALAV
jgi:hypothetical protein